MLMEQIEYCMNDLINWREEHAEEIQNDIPHMVPEGVRVLNRTAIDGLIAWRKDYHRTQQAIKMLKHQFAETQDPIAQHTLHVMQDHARALMDERNTIGDILRLTSYRYV